MGFLSVGTSLLEGMAPTLIGAAAGGLTSTLTGNGLSGLSQGAMGGSNASLSGMLSANDAFNTGLMGQEMGAQDQLDLQATLFDEAMDQQSENMRRIAATVSLATGLARLRRAGLPSSP